MAQEVADTEGDDTVREMIAARILSDTHLLAVVYAGKGVSKCLLCRCMIRPLTIFICAKKFNKDLGP